MDFNLKALGAETVMVDRRIVAQLAEAELLLRTAISVYPSKQLYRR